MEAFPRVLGAHLTARLDKRFAPGVAATSARILRLDEWLMLLGVPALGLFLQAGRFPSWRDLLIVTVASALGAAHLYTLNDYLGYPRDRHDPAKATRPLCGGIVSRRQQLAVTGILGALLLAFLLWLAPARMLVIAAAIEAVWIAYEQRPFFFKSRPVLGTLCNFVGTGFLPFLVGWGFAGPVDLRGVCLAGWTGAICAAGQVNREIVDAATDRGQGVRSTAAWLGAGRAHRVSFAAFAAATLYLMLLWPLGLAPASLALPVAFALPFHFVLFHRAKSSLDSREAVLRYIQRYRALYGAAGAVFLAVWLLT